MHQQPRMKLGLRLAACLLLLSGTAYAVPDYYVNGAVASSGNGTTWQTTGATASFKTIAEAVVAAGTAGGTKVIGVAPGTYAEAGTSGRIAFDATQSGDTISIQKYIGVDGAATACPVADGACLFSANTSNMLWFKTTCESGSFVWDGISITNASTSATIDFDDAVVTTDVTLKNCTITAPYGAYGVGTQAPARNITFDTVTFADGASVCWMQCNSVNKLTLKNCTGTFTSATSPTVSPINIGSVASSKLGRLLIDGGSLTVAEGANTSSAKALITVSANVTAGKVFLKDATLQNTAAAILRVAGGTASTVSVNVTGCTLNQKTQGTGAANAYTLYLGTDADTAATALGKVAVRNNTLTVDGNGTGNVAMFVGPECLGALVRANKIRGQNFTTGADAGIGIYLRNAAYSTVSKNDVFCRGAFCGVLANNVNITDNTFYSTTGSSTNGAACYLRDSQPEGTTDPSGIVLTGNIIATGGADYAFSIAPHDAAIATLDTWRIDNNLYWKSGATSAQDSIYVIDDAKKFTELEAYWVTVGGTAEFNDANSVYGQPLFRSVTTGDLRLSRSSPARGSRSATSPLGWATKGAYELDQGSGGGGAGLGVMGVGMQ